MGQGKSRHATEGRQVGRQEGTPGWKLAGMTEQGHKEYLSLDTQAAQCEKMQVGYTYRGNEGKAGREHVEGRNEVGWTTRREVGRTWRKEVDWTGRREGLQ